VVHEVHFQSERELIATFGPLVVWIDKGADARSHGIDRLAEIFEGVLSEQPAVAVLLVLYEGTRLPEGASRDSAAVLFDSLGDRFVGLTAILHGAGFWASALRSAVTGLGLELERQTSMHVFSTIEPAAEHLAGQLGISAQDVATTYLALEARLG